MLGLIGTLAALFAATGRTQDAAANGDTRTLSFVHTHTGESATITFRRDGQFDDQALTQLNWLLRDWRVNEPAKMDPRLFDILWEIRREVGSREPIHVISAYRSPQTNAMLRRRSKAVSEHSQHMAGKAMDVRIPDVDTARLRAAAMRLQYGGVGYYPSSAFVHVDTGSVRAWPRMSEEQLVRLFPDGKTLHLPPSGKPLARYEEAKAEIVPRNAAMASGISGSLGGFLARLIRGQGSGQTAPEPKPDAGSTTKVALASAEIGGAAEAMPLAPLPPRRPADLLLAAFEKARAPAPVASEEDWAAAIIALVRPEKKAGSAPDGASGASRLLFSPVRIDANPGARVAMARVAPHLVGEFVVDDGASLLDVRFSPQPQSDLGVERFAGPAVSPLPVLRQAGVAGFTRSAFAQGL